MATAVFPEAPPTRYIVTIVVRITTSTAARIGECPLYIIGKNKNKIHIAVNASPITEASPCFPPIIINVSRKIAIIRYTCISLSTL